MSFTNFLPGRNKRLKAHYGDPMGEQRRLETAAASGIVPESVGQWARDAIRVANGILGPDDVAAPGERMVFLHLDGSDNVLPAAGDLIYPVIIYPVVSSWSNGLPQPTDTAIGRLTSVANHHELGPVALAAINNGAPASSLIIATAENGEIYLVAASGQELPFGK